MPSRPAQFQDLARNIVSWFQCNARDLPWRRTRDPYGIWISEVMLQQTQVKTVVSYWERWMESFPDVHALAAAPEERVLKAWEGLGYYSRARNLQKAARQIQMEHNGRFPREFAAVLELPGIGRYTAGAICSIAYGQKTSVLDGNVARVLSRLFMVSGSVRERPTQDELWRLSSGLVEKASDSSAFNQGLMELGATVCLPRKPLCTCCPLVRRCRARRENRAEEFPNHGEKAAVQKRQFVALIIRNGGAVLVRKRASTVVNGGLWEFPNIEIPLRSDARTFGEGLGIQCQPLATIKHTITNNHITLRAFASEVNGNSEPLAKQLQAVWHRISGLDELPFSSAHARLRKLVQESDGNIFKESVA